MATTLAFKDLIDIPSWRPESPAIGATAAGSCLASDPSIPYHYFLRSATTLDAYDPTTGEWFPLASPALSGTFGAGACAVMAPSQGPRGTLAAGASTTKVTLTTALPAAVAINQLANRGDGVGFTIRIYDNTAAASGKMEERTIIANTAGSTPALTLSSALSFTPASGATYEIRSGRVFLFSAGTVANTFKYYDIATNSYSAALSTTNLAGTIGTDACGLHLSENSVPSDMKAGEGFIIGGGTYNGGLYRCIVATASTNVTNATITGSAMPADLQANEYTNFQVRIAEDATNPTAAGQRKLITSHTSGATGVFTLSGTWAVAPSATAKFVVENNDNNLLLRTTASTNVYNYSISGNAWDASTTWTVSGTAQGAGCTINQAFGVSRDTSNNHRHSFIYCIRGAGSTAIDVLDIAASATGTWTNAIAYGNLGTTTFNTGTCAVYDPMTLNGRFIYINPNGTQRMIRFDMRNRVMDGFAYLRFPQGAALVGGKLALSTFVDGTTKISNLYALTNTQTNYFSALAWR